MSKANKLASLAVDVNNLSDLADQVTDIENAIVRANTNAQLIDGIADDIEALEANTAVIMNDFADISNVFNSGITYSTDGVNEYYDANSVTNTVATVDIIEMNIQDPQDGELLSYSSEVNTWVNSNAISGDMIHGGIISTNAAVFEGSSANSIVQITQTGAGDALVVDGNIVVTDGYLAGPETFTIDPAGIGDNTGTVVIAGNLQVDGTTTTINSTTVTVDDLNLTLAGGAINPAAADGAGITVDGTSAALTYNGVDDLWKFTKQLQVEGQVFASNLIIPDCNTTPGYKYGSSGSYTLSIGGHKNDSSNQFTMFDIAGMNGSKYIEITINYGHAGGGIHGSYRRFHAYSNGYETLQVLEDTGNINYGGGNGFNIYKPDNGTVRVDWQGCSSFAISYSLYCEIKTNSSGVYITNRDSAFV